MRLTDALTFMVLVSFSVLKIQFGKFVSNILCPGSEDKKSRWLAALGPLRLLEDPGAFNSAPRGDKKTSGGPIRRDTVTAISTSV